MKRKPIELSDDDGAVGAVGAVAPTAAAVEVLEPDEYVPAEAPAHVFPTEADVERITAEVTDPANTRRENERALQGALRDEAARIATARRRRHTLTDLVTSASVFPTERHSDQLRAEVPHLSDAEHTQVLSAGHAAFVATLAAGEPILNPES